jgi:hypothetical protein
MDETALSDGGAVGAANLASSARGVAPKVRS